jgi:hypothetical protein
MDGESSQKKHLDAECQGSERARQPETSRRMKRAEDPESLEGNADKRQAQKS